MPRQSANGIFHTASCGMTPPEIPSTSPLERTHILAPCQYPSSMTPLFKLAPGRNLFLISSWHLVNPRTPPIDGSPITLRPQSFPLHLLLTAAPALIASRHLTFQRLADDFSISPRHAFAIGVLSCRTLISVISIVKILRIMAAIKPNLFYTTGHCAFGRAFL